MTRTSLTDLLGIELPIIQAPMAGVQSSALSVAVSNAGGLGSLPCALLDLDGVRSEVASIRAKTSRTFNVNFFCHAAPARSTERESAWMQALSRYYAELGLTPGEMGGESMRSLHRGWRPAGIAGCS